METHVVALSGGKDSTAMALRLQEVAPQDYTYICTPTGDELPEMKRHWGLLEILLGSPLVDVDSGYTLKSLCDRKKMLPNWRARFCTSELKIIPCQEFINQQAGTVKLYVGLRADEEGREGGIYENCEVVFPFREWGWGLEEVLEYLKQKEVTIPDRTDCARCFFQTLPEWWILWKKYPEIYQDSVDQEEAFGHTFRSPSRDTWPAALKDLRKEFENGRVPRGLKIDECGFSANKCRVCSL